MVLGFISCPADFQTISSWLKWGYLLEIKDNNVFLLLLVASLVFLEANLPKLYMIIHEQWNINMHLFSKL
ncbi:hypothetical protein CR513_17486, partial [Mucuna pruriens]